MHGPEQFLRSRDTLSPVSEPPRYPLALAACWIGGCGVVDAATGSALRVEPFYLPAVLALAWYFGRREGLIAAFGAAMVASVAAFAASSTASVAARIGMASWNFVALGVLFALPAWLVCALRAQQNEVARLNTTDSATGFATRLGLVQALTEELARTERLGGDTSLVCISLDGWSRLIAEHGRESALTVRRSFCDAIRLSARRIDTVGRLADDEFALLLRGTASSGAAAVADKLAQSLTDWLLTQGHDLSCSVGYTTAPRGRLLGADALLARAIAHLHECRSAGPASGRPPVVAVTAERESA